MFGKCYLQLVVLMYNECGVSNGNKKGVRKPGGI